VTVVVPPETPKTVALVPEGVIVAIAALEFDQGVELCGVPEPVNTTVLPLITVVVPLKVGAPNTEPDTTTDFNPAVFAVINTAPEVVPMVA
jgi:hypothetical protein